MANWYVSSAAYAAVQTWNAFTGGIATAVSIGKIVRSTAPAVGSERCFRCTTSGTTGTTEPTWNLNNNATTADGSAVWTQISGQESFQSAGNWTAPLARLSQLPNGTNSVGGAGFVTTGDTIFVSSDHAETQSGGYTVAGASPMTILSVPRAGASLPPTATDLLAGASVTVSGAGNQLSVFYGNGYIFGVSFISAGAIAVRCNDAFSTVYSGGSFQLTRAAGDSIFIQNSGSAGTVVWDNTTASFANVGQLLNIQGNFEWKNTAGAVIGAAVPNSGLFYFQNAGVYDFFVHGVDLSAVTVELCKTLVTNVPMGSVVFRDCKTANGVAFMGTGNSGWNAAPAGIGMFSIDNCDDSTGARNYRMFRSNAFGAIQQTTALVRAGGNTDGSTAFSWQMINNSNTGNMSYNNASRFPEIQQRFNTTGVAKTLTVYGISSFASIPTNGNMWLDVEYLGSAATPIASLISSKPATALTAAANLAADTSDWTANVSARQNTHAYSAGDLLKVADNTGRVFICTSGGTSAGSEPGGYASAVDGGNVTDGSATFMAMWRWKATVAFTPQMAGTIKCNPKTSLGTSMTPTANLLVIDPAFTLT